MLHKVTFQMLKKKGGKNSRFGRHKMSLGKGRTTELHKITADRKTCKIQQFDKADFRIANSF